MKNILKIVSTMICILILNGCAVKKLNSEAIRLGFKHAYIGVII